MPGEMRGKENGERENWLDGRRGREKRFGEKMNEFQGRGGDVLEYLGEARRQIPPLSQCDGSRDPTTADERERRIS